jgi:DNA-binding response OmpR family regulator
MRRALQNVPDCTTVNRVVIVLGICASECDHARLRLIFNHSNWRILAAHSRREASHFLEQHPVGVVICDWDLPDGSWRDVLSLLRNLQWSPLLIVAAPYPTDSLWAEALNLGAYDVLSKPLDAAEVLRIVSLAWLYWHEQTATARRAAAGLEHAGAAGGLKAVSTSA